MIVKNFLSVFFLFFSLHLVKCETEKVSFVQLQGCLRGEGEAVSMPQDDTLMFCIKAALKKYKDKLNYVRYTTGKCYAYTSIRVEGYDGEGLAPNKDYFYCGNYGDKQVNVNNPFRFYAITRATSDKACYGVNAEGFGTATNLGFVNTMKECYDLANRKYYSAAHLVREGAETTFRCYGYVEEYIGTKNLGMVPQTFCLTSAGINPEFTQKTFYRVRACGEEPTEKIGDNLDIAECKKKVAESHKDVKLLYASHPSGKCMGSKVREVKDQFEVPPAPFQKGGFTPICKYAGGKDWILYTTPVHRRYRYSYGTVDYQHRRKIMKTIEFPKCVRAAKERGFDAVTLSNLGECYGAYARLVDRFMFGDRNHSFKILHHLVIDTGAPPKKITRPNDVPTDTNITLYPARTCLKGNGREVATQDPYMTVAFCLKLAMAKHPDTNFIRYSTTDGKCYSYPRQDGDWPTALDPVTGYPACGDYGVPGSHWMVYVVAKKDEVCYSTLGDSNDTNERLGENISWKSCVLYAARLKYVSVTYDYERCRASFGYAMWHKRFNHGRYKYCHTSTIHIGSKSLGFVEARVCPKGKKIEIPSSTAVNNCLRIAYDRYPEVKMVKLDQREKKCEGYTAYTVNNGDKNTPEPYREGNMDLMPCGENKHYRVFLREDINGRLPGRGNPATAKEICSKKTADECAVYAATQGFEGMSFDNENKKCYAHLEHYVGRTDFGNENFTFQNTRLYIKGGSSGRMLSDAKSQNEEWIEAEKARPSANFSDAQLAELD